MKANNDTGSYWFYTNDSYLLPYVAQIHNRAANIAKKEKILLQQDRCLADFALGYKYFGLHFDHHEWILREWAPNATAVYLVGELTNWRVSQRRFALERINSAGVWQIRLPADTFHHQDLYRLRVRWPDGEGDRIPAYATRVVQDPVTLIFNAQVWTPLIPYHWQTGTQALRGQAPLIYEAHVGMAQEQGKIGTYREFTTHVLPRIIDAGYNVLQLMAIQEHPYYASFGYQVSSFFAPSSRFGSPDDLKELIDAAHLGGLCVTMDLVHSHAVANEVEGLALFDGTVHQYFHAGERGYHAAWQSLCFDYNKPEVLHFLLSNCRYWLDEYRFDGFRFDGVTSMVYAHHGLGKAFSCYADYFNAEVDEEALCYLGLANKLIHELRADAITIAEDVSGMPGLAIPVAGGGIGFNYRFAMGVPDYWIKLVKEVRDEAWPMSCLWHELVNKRDDERTISYAESHDQALVGDQSLLFRLIGAPIYNHMGVDSEHLDVDRGMALHKMIRLITLVTAGDGYLNFMGNEFGHPEWIDFPREGNGWSYHYARRQWGLADNPALRFRFLACFDRAMMVLVKRFQLLTAVHDATLLFEHDQHKILVCARRSLIFAFNFHPTDSYRDYAVRVPLPLGQYRLIMNSDQPEYGGHNRLSHDQEYVTASLQNQHKLRLYLPSRCALVLHKTPLADSSSSQ